MVVQSISQVVPNYVLGQGFFHFAVVNDKDHHWVECNHQRAHDDIARIEQLARGLVRFENAALDIDERCHSEQQVEFVHKKDSF